jgi:hypothetical protein
MKKIGVFILITTVLISAAFKASSAAGQGGPLYLWRVASREYATKIKQNPESTEAQSHIKLYAETYDLLSPVRMGGNVSKTSQDWNYRSHLYPYFRLYNKDIFLLEYANPRNWAGNIFGDESLPEEWYLHDPANDMRKETRMVNFWVTLNKTDVNAYNPWVYDMGNPRFVDFFANQVVKAMQAGLDGLWIDNAGIRKYVSKMKVWETEKTIVPINPRTGMKYTRAEELAEKLNMAQKIRTAVNRFNNGNSLQGRPFLLTPNIGNEIFDDEWAIVKAYGAAQSEGDAWFAPKNKTLSISKWVEQVTTIKQSMNLGIPWVYMGKPQTIAWPGKSRILFTYASALLGAGAKGDMFFIAYDYGKDWPGFHIDIGHSKGDFYKYPGTKNIYARKFEKALVLVNPSGESETIDVDFNYRRFLDASVGSNLKWQGLSNVSSKNVQISAHGAEILLLEHADTVQKGTTLSPPKGLKRVSK